MAFVVFAKNEGPVAVNLVHRTVFGTEGNEGNEGTAWKSECARLGHSNPACGRTLTLPHLLAGLVAANELPRSVAQTFCLPYRRLAACKVRAGTVPWHEKPPCEWLDSAPETRTFRAPDKAVRRNNNTQQRSRRNTAPPFPAYD
jgi:hypothetical protein